MHVKGLSAAPEDGNETAFRRRELRTALGTATWQLEEFERAVSGSVTEDRPYVGEDVSERHNQFIGAIRNQIACIEETLLHAEDIGDLKALPVIKLAQDENDSLARFLSGFTISDSSSEKDLSRSSSSDQKANEEAPGTSSLSVENKRGRPNECLVSASRSATSLSGTKFVKSDRCLQPCEVGRASITVDRPPSSGKVATDFHEIRVDHCDQANSDPGSEHFHRNCMIYPCSDRVGNHVEPENGQARSVSVGNNLDSWKSGRVLNGSRVCERPQMKDGFHLSKLWPFFKKRQHSSELGISKSGFKRWKDGDANLGDRNALCHHYNLMHGAGDLEEGSGNISLKGNSNLLNTHTSNGSVNCDFKQYKCWGEAPQRLLRSQYAQFTSRPGQIASAVLVALTLVGLLFFHVTLSVF